MKIVTTIFLLFFVTLFAKAHNILLPQPRNIIYGTGKVKIEGLKISSLNMLSDEGKFIAAAFSSKLKLKFNIEIESALNSSASPTLIFELKQHLNSLPGINEKTGPNCREAYHISVKNDEVKVVANSYAGFFYAVQTLVQLIEGQSQTASLPEVEISDWPILAYRGVMVDMSHGQMPKVEEIKKQIDFLSKWKINQFYFYSEASIELSGFPLLMEGAQYSKEDINEIVVYARQRFIDVIPIIELYGHMHDLFRLERYADLAVMPHGGEFKVNDSTRDVIIADWLTQLTKLFPSPFFHIGFDETWLLEKSARELKIAPELFYITMLNRTLKMVKDNGKHTMLWGDMLQKYPQIIQKIDKDVTIMPWHYFPMETKKYKKSFSPFTSTGINIIIQSASINWNWLVPLYNESFNNTDALIREVEKYNIVGFVNSGWIDDTQTLLGLTEPDMVYGAVSSWQTAPIQQNEFFKQYTSLQYSSTVADKVATGLQLLETGNILLNECFHGTIAAFWDNPFSANNIKLAKANINNLRKGRLAVESAQAYFKFTLDTSKDTSSVFAYKTGARMLDYLALKYLYAIEITDLWNQFYKYSDKDEWKKIIFYEVAFKYHTRTSDMMDAIFQLKEMFAEASSHEYGTSRKKVALAKYNNEFQFWWKLQLKLSTFLKNYKIGDNFPTLSSLIK
jgi:hexosaminidase